MGINWLTYLLAKKYTKDTAAQFGAVKGAPCKVKSVEDIEGGHRVTFEWKNDAGAVQETGMNVMNGERGERGETGEKGATGQSGVSPEIGVVDIAGGHRVTITDATHPEGQAFDVMNGKGAADMVREGDWLYKISDDGTFDAYYYKSGVNLVITAQSGNFYRTEPQTLPLPTGITDGYDATPIHAVVNVAHKNYSCIGSISSLETNQIVYHGLSGGNRSANPNYFITAHVFGTLQAKA